MSDHPNTPFEYSPISESYPDAYLRHTGHEYGWADQAYNAIRNADDVGTMAHYLKDAQRQDGSRGFSHHEIADVKDHLFYKEHALTARDGSIVRDRFESNPDIADAWLRLRRGKHTETDLLLLEHELAEQKHFQQHPDATYEEAHHAANQAANWEKVKQRTAPEDHEWTGPKHDKDRTYRHPHYWHGDPREPLPGQSGGENHPPDSSANDLGPGEGPRPSSAMHDHRSSGGYLRCDRL